MALAPSALAATPPQLGVYGIVPLNASAQIDIYPPTDENGSPIEGLTYQASLNGGTWATFAVASNPDFGTLQGTITGLTNGTEYRVRVRAVDNGDEGPASDPPVSVIPGRPSAPFPSPAPRDRGAVVTINPPSSDGGSAVVSYDISVTTDAAARNWVDAQETEADGVITSTRTGLTNGTTYYVAVRARNASGPGLGSEPVAVVPGLPTAPSLNGATAGDQSATLTFNPPAENGGAEITAYDVSALPLDNNGEAGRQFTTYPLSDVVEDPNDPSSRLLTIGGLSNGTQYNIVIRARNRNGPGAESGAQQPTPDTAPAAPTDVVATTTPSNDPSVAGGGTATITFTPPPGGGGTNPTDVTSYTVTSTPDGAESDCLALTSCAITKLNNGTAYTFTITANNANSNGIASDPVQTNSVTPSGAPYAPRSIARAGATPNSATVSFLQPVYSGSPVTRYQVSSDNGKSWRTVTTRLSGSRRLAVVPGLRSGVRYFARVRAGNALGFGVPSAPIVVLTAPSAVVGRPTARAGTSAALIRWTPSRERDVVGYVVTSTSGARCYTYTRTETSCIIGNTAGVRTFYRVFARSAAGLSFGSAATKTVVASWPSVPSRLPGVPGGFRAVSKKVKSGKNASLVARGFLPSSSIVLVAYGRTRHVVKRFTANAAGNFVVTVKMPKDSARSLTFVAFGVTPYASSKAIAASIRRG